MIMMMMIIVIIVTTTMTTTTIIIIIIIISVVVVIIIIIIIIIIILVQCSCIMRCRLLYIGLIRCHIVSPLKPKSFIYHCVIRVLNVVFVRGTLCDVYTIWQESHYVGMSDNPQNSNLLHFVNSKPVVSC